MACLSEADKLPDYVRAVARRRQGCLDKCHRCQQTPILCTDANTWRRGHVIEKAFRGCSQARSDVDVLAHGLLLQSAFLFQKLVHFLLEKPFLLKPADILIESGDVLHLLQHDLPISVHWENLVQLSQHHQLTNRTRVVRGILLHLVTKILLHVFSTELFMSQLVYPQVSNFIQQGFHAGSL